MLYFKDTSGKQKYSCFLPLTLSNIISYYMELQTNVSVNGGSEALHMVLTITAIRVHFLQAHWAPFLPLQRLAKVPLKTETSERG